MSFVLTDDQKNDDKIAPSLSAATTPQDNLSGSKSLINIPKITENDDTNSLEVKNDQSYLIINYLMILAINLIKNV